MLSLCRKEGESVMVGKDIKITVYQVNGNQVRLSFDAPLDVRIDREEIFLARKEENLQ